MNRRTYDLNRNWLHGGRMKEGANQPGYDDSTWERITLPHSNALLPWHGFDDRA